MPAKIASEKEVRLANQFIEGEFNPYLTPRRTATGYRVYVARTLSVMTAMYPWLPNEEMWKPWGDWREIGDNRLLLL